MILGRDLQHRLNTSENPGQGHIYDTCRRVFHNKALIYPQGEAPSKATGIELLCQTGLEAT